MPSLRDALSTSRTLLTAIVDFRLDSNLDFELPQAKFAHLEPPSIQTTFLSLLYSTFYTSYPIFSLIFHVHYLHLNAKIERENESRALRSHYDEIVHTLLVMKWKLEDLMVALRLEGVKAGEGVAGSEEDRVEDSIVDGNIGDESEFKGVVDESVVESGLAM